MRVVFVDNNGAFFRGNLPAEAVQGLGSGWKEEALAPICKLDSIPHPKIQFS